MVDIVQRRLIPGGKMWGLLLFALFGYAALNRGFAYIGVYPIFVGELTLFFYLVFVRHSMMLPRFLETGVGKLWLANLAYSFLIFFHSFFRDPSDSIRNSVIWVYSLFFYIGYCYGNKLVRDGEFARLEKFFLVISFVVIVYLMGYPWAASLQAHTAFLADGESLLGQYKSVHIGAVSFLFFLVLYKKVPFRVLWLSLGFTLLLVLVQSRTSMLAIAGILLYLLFVNRQALFVKRLAAVAVLLVGMLSVYFVTGIQLSGHRGALNSQSFEETFLSIFEATDDSELDGAKEDRLEWWSDVIKRTISSPASLVFGMGYNTILVNRVVDGKVQRTPHNSYIATFGYSGAIGLILFLLLCGNIVFSIQRVCARAPKKIMLFQWYPLFAICFLVSAFFGPSFENPYESFLFWVISGIFFNVTRWYDQKVLVSSAKGFLTETDLAVPLLRGSGAA